MTTQQHADQTDPLEQLEAADIATGTDPHGRPVVYLPDHQARTLRHWIAQHWTEIHGMADGYTDKIAPGHRHYQLAALLAAAQHTTGNGYPFICGHSFTPGTGTGTYDLLVSTCGIRTHQHNGHPVYSFTG